MRNLLLGTCLLASLAWAVGCGQGQGVSVDGKQKPSPTVGSEAKGSSDPAKPAAVDSALKHDAYQYNGLDQTKALKYLFSQVQGQKATEGEQTVTLTKSSASEADFEVKRTGSLQVLGDQTSRVMADGVYLVSTTLGSPSKPVMVMPAKVEPGTVWEPVYALEATGGTKVQYDGKARAERIEKVKVAAGEFDALLVTETAKMDNGGNKGTVSSKTWYAKGVGIVKMRMELKDASGKIVTSTVELSDITE